MENQENQQEPTTNKTSPALWVSIILVIIVLGVGAYFLFIQDDTTNTNNANTTVNTNTPVNENVNAVSNTNTETNTNAATNTNSTSNTNKVINSNTATNVDTSEWETYRNEKYGYSFKYPKNWATSNSAIDNQISINSSVELLSFYGGLGMTYLDAYSVDEKIDSYIEDFGQNQEFQSFSNNDIKGVTFITNTLGADWVPTVLIARPTFTLSFSLSAIPDDERSTYKSIFDEIVNTITSE
ncbi:MAG: hypothetical protein Q8P20_02805 [bacterium]|nr:hypothetical protein [bacterium]